MSPHRTADPVESAAGPAEDGAVQRSALVPFEPADALEPPDPAGGQPPVALAARPPKRRRRLLIASFAIAVITIAGLATALVLTTLALRDQEHLAQTNAAHADHNRTVADEAVEESRQNATRAAEWQERADGTRARLVEVNAQLDAAQERVASVQERLTGQQKAVRSLERRQRQLANEKAQVEDQRLALERRSVELEDQTRRLEQQASSLIDVANGFISCKGGLSQLVDAALYEDYEWMLANGPGIYSTCNVAEETLAGYQATYG